jgi:hypothetical protein
MIIPRYPPVTVTQPPTAFNSRYSVELGSMKKLTATEGISFLFSSLEQEVIPEKTKKEKISGIIKGKKINLE